MEHMPRPDGAKMAAPLGRAAAPHRVLVVDDDWGVRTVIPRLLAKAGLGCECEVAGDGLEGLLQLAAFHPDLIILDLEMPNLDGADFCLWLTQHGSYKPKVLILTGNAGDGRLQKALDAGADAWMAKPPNMQDFVRTVHGMMGG